MQKRRSNQAFQRDPFNEKSVLLGAGPKLSLDKLLVAIWDAQHPDPLSPGNLVAHVLLDSTLGFFPSGLVCGHTDPMPLANA